MRSQARLYRTETESRGARFLMEPIALRHVGRLAARLPRKELYAKEGDLEVSGYSTAARTELHVEGYGPLLTGKSWCQKNISIDKRMTPPYGVSSLHISRATYEYGGPDAAGHPFYFQEYQSGGQHNQMFVVDAVLCVREAVMAIMRAEARTADSLITP